MKSTGAAFKLTNGLFGRKRLLRLHPAYLEYENGSPTAEPFTRIRKEDIADIRYSADWNIWYRFYVGSTYRVEVKTKDHKVLRIKFTSYFSTNEKYRDAFDEIVDLLWEYYLEDIVQRHLAELEAGEQLPLAGFTLSAEGVSVPEKKLFISWEEVEVKEYETYYMVYNRRQPEVNQAISQGDWGSEVLSSIIKSVKEKAAGASHKKQT